ncbi:1,4-dihydroxy-2-naphthoyl-CoA thioesterase 1-like [Actinidia eriantha]|uniref:1,4-dihydroxy-2-naphthoyl-CoA thioesterase 1-like n=1 Tax=Actinidia eriantha TaxID=165200 RepID=UPI002589EC15|nr:1,4-dihydroxy-2-naphthoyl-CoA thioesterase 1-like [Actinidia eriantha]
MEFPPPPSSSSRTELLDAPLHAIGFEIEDLSPDKITGRLHVTHKCCQVWEVRLYKVDPSSLETKYLISSSRVTLLSNMPVPGHAKDDAENLKKYAKL